MGNENITLSIAEIENYLNQGPGKSSGKYLRYLCPIHGGDNQRSLALDPETGHFKCHQCDAWGYTPEGRERYKQERGLSMGRGVFGSKPAPPPYRPRKIKQPPPRPELAQALIEFQKALPGGQGERYLKARGLSFEVAQAYGVGYAARGRWPNPKTDWKWGRVVFPHTNPAGELVNLYGRATGGGDSGLEGVPKGFAHAHLQGNKGYFNARALVEGAGPLYVCEGAFDALALIAAGAARTVAIFGVNGWRWEWCREIRELIFCLDADERGQEARQEISRAAAMRGKSVAYLPPEVLGSHKDISEAWAAGALNLALPESISDPDTSPPLADFNLLGEVATWPAERREAWEEKAAFLEFENKMTRPDAERAAFEMLQGSAGA